MLKFVRRALNPRLHPMIDYSKWSKNQLIQRITELEQGQVKPSSTHPLTESQSNSPSGSEVSASPEQPKKKKKAMDFSKFATRKVAIRFSYLGWGYNGLAVQSNADPNEVRTVEHEILSACHKTRLIPTMDTADCDFSRCGRTDRGVSALRQVISMRVRSLLTPEEQKVEANDHRELDYLHILNNLLPSDIRVFEICMRPGDDFDARFSCTSRHYKYFFTSGEEHDQQHHHHLKLDIEKMNRAAQYFLGEHDFRNFCKVDASKQITNFRRGILESSIKHHSGNIYYFNLRGTAFLWHQVRSMIAILLNVGQGIEKPEIVKQMLDMEIMPTRPVYEMAADYPLVLYDCEFPPDMEWKSFRNFETMQKTKDSAYNLWYEQYIKSTMSNEMIRMLDSSSSAEVPEDLSKNKYHINVGSGKGRALVKYVPLEKRQRLDSPEEVNRRYLEKKHEKSGRK